MDGHRISRRQGIEFAENKRDEPSFHCDVHILAAPDGAQYPIITVPGGHRTPIRAKSDGPNGQTVKQHSYYIRRPGPQSEVPQTAAEWDALIRRCVANAREDLLNQFRSILGGQAPAEPPPSELEVVGTWFDASMKRWNELVKGLPADDPKRLPPMVTMPLATALWIAQEMKPAELREAIIRARFCASFR